MKESYVKPEFVVEHFGLTQTIAQSCGYNPANPGSLGKPAHDDKDVCAWDVGSVLVFTDSNAACVDEQVPSYGDFDGICYNNPNGGVTIFAS